MKKQELTGIVRKATQGDVQAFGQLCELKARSILFAAAQIMGNHHDAEDAAQEVMIMMQRYITKLREPEGFGVWLHRIILNECRKVMLKNKKTMCFELLDDYANQVPEDKAEFLPHEFAESEEKRAVLMEAVNRLPGKCKHIVLLYYYEDMSYAEIADVLGVNTKYVDNQLTRAKKLIRKHLETKTGAALGDAYAFVPVPVMAACYQTEAVRMFPEAQVRAFAQKYARVDSLPVRKPAKVSGGMAAMQLTGALAAAALVLTLVLGPLGPIHTAGRTPGANDLPPSGGTSAPQQRVSAGAEEEITQNGPAGPGNGGGAAQAITIAPVPMADGSVMQLKGRVYLRDNSGSIISGHNDLLEGMGVVLEDAEGREVGRGTLDENGEFALDAPLVEIDSSYEIRLDLPRDNSLVATAENPGAKVAVRVSPGAEEGALVTLSVRKAKAPEAAILFLGGDCACGHINPKRIRIETEDVMDTSQTWEVVRKRDGEVVAAGTVSEVTGELNEMELELDEGIYTLRCFITDKTGNSREVKADFSIINGPVDPLQYP